MTTTADHDLLFSGPAAMAELVRAGEVHPRELVELSLRRIEALNPRVNAFRVTMAEEALAAAEGARRLRDAGAIPIGITNVPELTIFPWTATDANGVTRNPWDLSRTPGGSSGGSAAAVASGMVPCATGSDGGGSIRIPAAACGLVGMKPTRGRVSM